MRTGAVAGSARRRIVAVAISALLPLLGLAGIGDAQQAVQISGILEAVDCSAQTVVLSAPTGANTVAAAAYTAVLINSTSVPFCTLEAYIGAPATAWLVANGNQFTATQIAVTGPPTAPAPADVTAGVSPVPIWGVVLGTVVVAGLLYLLVQGPDGGYYRYPYWGEYYRRYYHPEYRLYAGAYPASAPIIAVAALIAGTVLGIVVIDNLQYILSRDAAGHLYRYPYYGPYRQVYYRPTYRPYQGPYTTTGSYRSAPVRQGDPRWDAPARTVRPAPGTPNAPRPVPAPIRPTPGPQPVPVRPPTPAPAYQPPASQRPPAPAYQRPAPQRPPVPAYQPPPPPRPPAPAYRPPTPQRPPAPAYQLPQPSGPQCGGPDQPPCPGGGAPAPAPAYRPAAPPSRPPATPAPAHQAPRK